MALFRKKSGLPLDDASLAAPSAQWELPHLVGRVRDAAPAFEARDVEAALVHARLADHYRDLELTPLPPAEFERLAGDLDVEGWRRLAVVVATLDDPGLRAALGDRAPWLTAAAQVESGFLGLARDIAPLTIALVRQSAVRAEEFARHFAMRLGVGIVGESLEQSRARLHALDYKRLLAEADQAKAAAHEKMERLRKKQQESDRRGRRRGKF
jgi:hypothetical protein